MKSRFLYPAIFLLSAAGMAYQMALMRIFAIAQWHHFAYMIISIAMLGFAAGGTIGTFLRAKYAGAESNVIAGAAFLLCLSFILCYAFSQKIPFETYQLISQPKQIGYLLALYGILSIPFFLLSLCILQGLVLDSGHLGRLYAANMIGSGAGALGAVFLLNWVRPEKIPYLLTLPAAAACLLLAVGNSRRIVRISLALIFSLSVLFKWADTPLQISEYKGLAYALRIPDAQVIAQSQSPLSVITAVRSSMIRETPGQISFRYPWKESGPLPEQIGLFFDADSISPLNRFQGDFKPFSYLDYVTSALPYHLINAREVLIMGPGGGTPILQVLARGVEHITAVEVDPRVFSVIQKHFKDFSGGIYEHASVTTVIAEGREFLQSRGSAYDLINIPPLDSFSAASAGVYALNESYLYTVEAFKMYLEHLTPQGVLSITRWFKTPPRDELKLFATMIEALEKTKVNEPGRHLAVIRSWNTVTLLMSRSPWHESQIQSIRDFIQTRGFDAIFYPGVRPEETNRFSVLQDPVYEQAIPKLMERNREQFYRDYLFDIRPATDNRPYFFQFFKWKSLMRLLKGMGLEWVPFVEWGYLILLATLIQAVAASVFLLGIPALFQKEKIAYPTKCAVFLFFTSIGFAYMFLEIAFIQRFMLFLGFPIYAVAVVLTAFLIFSGVGSFAADRYSHSNLVFLLLSVAGIVIISGLYLLILPRVFAFGVSWSRELKVIASIFLLAPLAFCMGIPFPSGMQKLCHSFESSIPWAWAINGCASVLGAILATLLAVHFGFNFIVILALLMYGVALGTFVLFQRNYEKI